MSTSIAPQTKPPVWRNATFLKWAAQIGVFTAVVVFGWLLISTAMGNMRAQGLSFDWDLLTDPPGIQLSEGIYTRPTSGLQVFATGIVNMLRITASGIIAATFLGVVVGITRLSSNWLLSKVATFFVESIRNIPLLVQIVFWFFLCSLFFPALEDDTAGPIPGWLVITRKGVSLPWLFPQATFWQWFVFVAAGVIAGRWMFRRRVRLLEETGQNTHPGRYGFLVFLGFAVVGWWAHPIAGALGWLWQLFAGIVSTIPQIGWQLLFGGLAVFFGARWILRFLDSRRTPAGLARLTDDDYFRMFLAGAVGLIGAGAFLFVPGITDLITGVTETVFRFFDEKFDFLRTGAPLALGRPSIVTPGRFPQIGATGMTMTPAFFGVWIGVTLYTASFIAEIVRGGILAVSRGQTEAGLALGLKRSQLLRLIVLPQAFRIILPPMGNQYLNLGKNTSLGIAVAYAEPIQVGQTLFNQTGDTIQVFIVWMAFYLAVSLVLSAIVNWYNRKLALVER